MNSEVVVFLDTSIQIERVIGNKTRQVQIEQELKHPARHFVTSSYVFMEFQRSLWADFVYVYNLMQQHTDWQTIAYRLRSGARSHRSRALGNCLQIFAWALVASHLDRERALDFVELQVTQSLPEDFWWHVTPLPDPLSVIWFRAGCAFNQMGSVPLPRPAVKKQPPAICQFYSTSTVIDSTCCQRI